MPLEYIVRPSKIKSEQPSPAIIVMHGYGADEHDLLPIASLLSDSVTIISLRAPIDLSLGDFSFGGYAWYHLERTTQGLKSDTASRLKSESLIIESLPEIINRERFDPTRIVLLGFSQGAAMSYSLLARDDFSLLGISLKAVIALSGYLPQDIKEPLSKKNLHQLQIFISHGEFDELIPFAAMDETTKYLRQVNADLTAKLYPIGHRIDEDVLDDLKHWFNRLAF